MAHVKATQRIVEFMEASDKEATEAVAPPADADADADVPQDMSLSNLNYSQTHHSYGGADRLSSSMELDNYH